MIQPIIVLAVTVIVLSGISFLIIKNLRKKNKSLDRALDFAQKEIQQMRENEKAFQKTVSELLNIRDKYNELRNEISNSDGANLSINLNKL